MNFTERDLSLVVGDLKNNKITEGAMDLMRLIISHGFGGRLVTMLIEAQTDHAQAISRSMANFETLAENDRTLACILMSHLWSSASDERAHEICDAIDLWLWDNDSVELQSHLRTLASSERNPSKRRHFEQLVERKLR